MSLRFPSPHPKHTWMSGQQLMDAWLNPAIPCTAPGPETVNRAAGTPVRNPEAAAAYPAACSLRNPM